MISINFTYSDTLKEYVDTLVNILLPHIYDGIISISKESKRATSEKNHIVSFQQFLKAIRGWSDDTKKAEYTRIADNSGCIYFEKLIKAILTSNARILLGRNREADQIISQISADPCDFVFKCYLEVARKLYTQPLLIIGEKAPIENQRDINHVFDIIKNSIGVSIRESLPMEDLIDKYLSTTPDSQQDEDYIKQLSDNFQEYLSSYMRKVNRVIGAEVEEAIKKERDNLHSTDVKTVSLSPMAISPEMSPVMSPVPIESDGEDTHVSVLEMDGRLGDAGEDISLAEPAISIVEGMVGDELGFESANLDHNTEDYVGNGVDILDDGDFFDKKSEGGNDDGEIGMSDYNQGGGGVEIIGDVNPYQDERDSSSDGKRTIDLGGVKGGKKWMTKRQRDIAYKGGSSNFSFFDDAQEQ